MEQLRPFLFFFTLSCAERIWAEVFCSILQSQGHNVIFDETTWDGDEEEILIDGIPLPDYKENHLNMSVTDFVKKYYVIITRIFDNRVKAFIKNILMNIDPNVEYYWYRVEFQARGMFVYLLIFPSTKFSCIGMPHVHGVLWYNREALDDYMDNGVINPEKLPALVEKWISCSLKNDSEELNELVRKVQIHKHTPSCQRKGKCRFSYPRFPSERTIIACPPKDDMPEDERKDLINKAGLLLKKVITALEEIKDLDEDPDLDDFLKSLNIDKKEYYSALEISVKGNTVILKRRVNECMVNNYCSKMILPWQANVDIQICSDHYALVTYVTDYISKVSKF